jgi:hypothetical protein
MASKPDVREKELQEVPLWAANKQSWPKGVRTIGAIEMDCLAIDRSGRLYWDGKAIEVRQFKLRTFELTLAVIGVTAAVAAVVLGGWEWFCQLAWLGQSVCPPTQ